MCRLANGMRRAYICCSVRGLTVSLVKDPVAIVYSQADVLSLPIHRKYERVEMEPEVREGAGSYHCQSEGSS